MSSGTSLELCGAGGDTRVYSWIGRGCMGHFPPWYLGNKPSKDQWTQQRVTVGLGGCDSGWSSWSPWSSKELIALKGRIVSH